MLPETLTITVQPDAIPKEREVRYATKPPRWVGMNLPDLPPTGPDLGDLETTEKPMGPEQFAVAMGEHFKGDYDQEAAHANADELLCKLLESLGYGDGVKVFREADKWYA